MALIEMVWWMVQGSILTNMSNLAFVLWVYHPLVLVHGPGWLEQWSPVPKLLPHTDNLIFNLLLFLIIPSCIGCLGCLINPVSSVIDFLHMLYYYFGSSLSPRRNSMSQPAPCLHYTPTVMANFWRTLLVKITCILLFVKAGYILCQLQGWHRQQPHTHTFTLIGKWKSPINLAGAPGGNPCRHTGTLQVNITVTMLTTVPPFQCLYFRIMLLLKGCSGPWVHKLLQIDTRTLMYYSMTLWSYIILRHMANNQQYY